MTNLQIFELRPDRNSEATPEAASQIFSSLYGKQPSFLARLFGRQKPFVFEILSYRQITHFLVHTPQEFSSYVQGQIAAHYPKAGIGEVQDPLTAHISSQDLAAAALKLASVYYFPLKTWREFTDSDPLAAILGNMAKAEKGDLMLVQLILLPADKDWREKALHYAETGGGLSETGEKQPHPKADLIQRKIEYNGFRTGIRLLAAADSYEKAQRLLASLAGSFGALSLGGSNHLVMSAPRFYQKKKFIRSVIERKPDFIPKNQILNVDELATIFHLPAQSLSGIKSIAWGGTLLGEPPENLPVISEASEEEKKEINFFARTEFKNQNVIFGIKRADRRRHMYIIGKSGTGKSTLIANMAINDMRHGEGLAVIDPHGDLSENLLDYIPSFRINDVAYLDAAIANKRPFRMNLLEVKHPEHAELVASGIVSIFQKLYGYSWGPRLEYILRNTILTLVARPNSTLVDVPRLLTNTKFRNKVVKNLKDPVLTNFWNKEFAKMSDRLQSEAVAPILNKVGQFVSSPTIRQIIGFPSSTIDLEDAMNQGKIIILNLSQGRLGEDNAALLGAMLITKIQLAAMNRASIPEAERRDFYLYIDEFQNFATTSFVKILSEARKYHLNLTLANQYIGQVPEEVQSAIFGNIGTLISFLVGAEDAEVLEREFGGVYTQADLVSLGNYQIALRLAIDGRTSYPFSAYTLPLPKNKNENREKVIRVSRERYTKEAKASFLTNSYHATPPVSQSQMQSRHVRKHQKSMRQTASDKPLKQTIYKNSKNEDTT